MNPETNRFEELTALEQTVRQQENRELRNKLEALTADTLKSKLEAKLFRPDGTPVPEHWTVFRVGEILTIKNYNFKVAYIGETSILFEPVGPVLVGQTCNPE